MLICFIKAVLGFGLSCSGIPLNNFGLSFTFLTIYCCDFNQKWCVTGNHKLSSIFLLETKNGELLKCKGNLLLFFFFFRIESWQDWQVARENINVVFTIVNNEIPLLRKSIGVNYAFSLLAAVEELKGTLWVFFHPWSGRGIN